MHEPCAEPPDCWFQDREKLRTQSIVTMVEASLAALESEAPPRTHAHDTPRSDKAGATRGGGSSRGGSTEGSTEGSREGGSTRVTPRGASVPAATNSKGAPIPRAISELEIQSCDTSRPPPSEMEIQPPLELFRANLRPSLRATLTRALGVLGGGVLGGGVLVVGGLLIRKFISKFMSKRLR